MKSFFIKNHSDSTTITEIANILETEIDHNKNIGLYSDSSLQNRGNKSIIFEISFLKELALQYLSNNILEYCGSHGFDFILNHKSLKNKVKIELKNRKTKLFDKSNSAKINIHNGTGGNPLTDLKNYLFRCDYFLLVQENPYEMYIFKADKNIEVVPDLSRGKDLAGIFKKSDGIKLNIPKFINKKNIGLNIIHRLFNMRQHWIKNRIEILSFFDFQHANRIKNIDKDYDQNILQMLESSIEWGSMFGVIQDLYNDSGINDSKNPSMRFIKSNIISEAFQILSGGLLHYKDGVGYDFLLDNSHKIEIKTSRLTKFSKKNSELTIFIKHDGKLSNSQTYKFECDYFLIVDSYNAYLVKADSKYIELNEKVNDNSDLTMTIKKENMIKLNLDHIQRKYSAVDYSKNYESLLKKYLEDTN